MRAEAMATYTRSLLEPLVAHVAVLETTIRELERENGRQAAENEALRAQHAALLASTAEQPPDPSPAPPPPPGPFPAPLPPSLNVMAWLQARPIWRWVVVVIGLVAIAALAWPR